MYGGYVTITISMCLGCGRLGMIRPLPNPPRSLGVDRVRNMSEVVACIVVLAYVVRLVCGWDVGCAGNRGRVDPE